MAHVFSWFPAAAMTTGALRFAAFCVDQNNSSI
jgi:hypothetical protein